MPDGTYSLDTSPTGLRITRFSYGGQVRFIPQDRTTLRPIPWLCVYEAYLSQKHASHNTVYDAIQSQSLLLAWAKIGGIQLDKLFFKGEVLEPREVNAFGAWLRHRGMTHSKREMGEAISAKAINKALRSASRAFRWFAMQNAVFEGRRSDRAIKLDEYLKHIKELFKDANAKVVKKKEAEDLTEDEITAIEQFMAPENRLKMKPKLHRGQVQRDYLIWRLSIEFGLREGEILALRLDDCPSRYRNHISIVRIEERGENYNDPRTPYAPRPKTLSRELGFILKNSPIPKLITEYTTRHRRRRVLKHGRKIWLPVLDNPAFLILSHQHDKGNPLSLTSMQDVASEIREGTGIDHFHWHIARHAFFNRAYASIMDLKEKDNEIYKERLNDLVYWGGWEDEKSLQLYINRARRERAKVALSFYQNESFEWASLK